MSLGTNIKKHRLSKSLSLQQLADLVGLSKAAIQQYEDGTTQPSPKALLSIAQALKVNLWGFFDHNEVTLELAEFRHGEKLADSALEKQNIHDLVIAECQGYVELDKLLGTQIKFINPLAGIEIATLEDVEAAVIKLRKKWKLYHLPIDDLTNLLENQGIKVITVSRQTDSPGVCGFVKDGNESIPFIIINIVNDHIRELTRKRFTLAHEAAHLFLEFKNTISSEMQERLCNRFASAFLLPSNALLEFLGNHRTGISLAELKELKQMFGLSVMSIIYRANEIGLINRETCTKWTDQYNQWRDEQKDFGGFTKSNEEPSRLNRLVNRALSEQRVSKEKIAELLNIPVDQLNAKFSNEKLNLI